MMPPYIYLDLEEFVRVRIGDVPLEEIWNDPVIQNAAEDMILKSILDKKFTYPDDPLTAVPAFHLALTVLALSESSTLIRKFLDTISPNILSFLNNLNETQLSNIIKILNIKLKKEEEYIPWIINNKNIIKKKLIYSTPLKEYLRETAAWNESLPNSFLKNRKIYFDKINLIKYLSIIIKNKILYLLYKYKEIYSQYDYIIMFINKINKQIKEEFNIKIFPQCIQELINKASATTLSDEEIYVILTFLANSKLDEEVLSDILYKARLADALKSKILARTLPKLRKFTPYNCRGPLNRICNPCPSRGLLRDYYSRLRSLE